MNLRVALAQMSSGPEIDANLAAAGDLIRRAADDGAGFILTPENTGAMALTRAQALAITPGEDLHPGPPAFQALARETGAWLLAGSFAVLRDDGLLANRSMLFAPDGAVAARYDKIHLFEFVAPDGAQYRESETYAPGDRAVIADTAFGKVGMTICYDVRFAALYRALAQAGARLITVPAAFTVPTGEAHWHILLRARAIETGAFILAPGQTGTHADGKATYGHSLIVAPWGEVLADGGKSVGLVTADLDLDRVAAARDRLQSLRHDRSFASP